MRCDLCPLCPPQGEYGDDVCPEMDGPLGIVHRDGMGGCKHPYNWAKKRDEGHSDCLRKMGEEMGREMMQEGCRKDAKMKIEEGKPFSSGTDYEIFLDNWCYECVHYKARIDGFPEFPENGGCPVLDAMEYARFDLSKFPSKDIIEERDEDGNVLYWHKCTKFKRKRVNSDGK